MRMHIDKLRWWNAISSIRSSGLRLLLAVRACTTGLGGNVHLSWRVPRQLRMSTRRRLIIVRRRSLRRTVILPHGHGRQECTVDRIDGTAWKGWRSTSSVVRCTRMRVIASHDWWTGRRTWRRTSMPCGAAPACSNVWMSTVVSMLLVHPAPGPTTATPPSSKMSRRTGTRRPTRIQRRRRIHHLQRIRGCTLNSLEGWWTLMSIEWFLLCWFSLLVATAG